MPREFRHGILSCLLLASCLAGAASGRAAHPEAARGVSLVRVQGKTELQVDGVPFFVHAAEFPYFRVPADLWERSLEEHRTLGINTIELVIPWNWHEIRSGEMDFDGRTNPRRNLRKLLRLVTERELKLIVRPAAQIPEWRDAGFPDWLGPSAGEIEALQERFLRALAMELLPYLPAKAFTIPDRDSGKEGAQKTVSGPLLLVAVPRASAAVTLRASGLHAAAFVTEESLATAEIPAAGQLPKLPPLPERPVPGLPSPVRAGVSTLEEIEFTAAWLSLRDEFPVLLRDAFPGTRAPAEDIRAVESTPADGLLLSRLAFAQGAGGITYGTIQDSLDPAGFTTPGFNPFARVDAALDINAARQPAAQTILRNGMLLEFWGEFLAGAEKRSDLSLVAGNSREEFRKAWLPVFRAARAAGITLGAADPQRQSLERILRAPILLWNTRATGPLPEPAQSALLEYVRRGGTLFVFPTRPEGKSFEGIGSAPEGAAGQRSWEKGRVIEVREDPFATLAAEPGATATELRAASQALLQWVQMSEARPVIRRPENSESLLALSQLVPAAGTSPLGDGRADNTPGLLSVINLAGETVEETIEVLSPRLSSRARGDAYMRIPISIAAQESLLLPLHAPLCSAAGKEKCDDEILISSAEFLFAERDGKQLELTFYAPARSTVRLRLEQAPSRARADEMSIDGIWTPATRTFEAPIPRGPAPHYLRVLRIQLPYEPHVPKKPDPEKTGRRDYDHAVADGWRFPLASDAALETYPPLIALKPDSTGRMSVKVTNHDRMGRGVDLRVSGPVKGNSDIGLDAGELGFRRIDLKPEGGGGVKPGLVEGQLDVKSGRDQRRSPVAFVVPDEKLPFAYSFDFDRDGWPEQVLEDRDMRAIVSPERGGRLVGLVDKESGLALTNVLGMFRDSLVNETADAPPPADLGAMAYSAEPVTENERTMLRLTSPMQDGFRLQKTFSIAEKQSLEVAYRWQGAGLAARSVVTTLSVPVTLHGDNTTRFCWEKPRPAGDSGRDLPQSAPEMQCELFTPHGRPVLVPQGIQHLEVRTPGSFALRLEWPAGELRVEMKNYSAELRFAFPRAAAGAEAGSGALKLSAVVVE